MSCFSRLRGHVFLVAMTNFDYLKKEPKFDSFSDVAIATEKILYIDPISCIINCRRAMEFAIKWIVDKYNSIYKLQMPEITPHVCCHTYCSNMAKSGINPKTLQYLMGHADIGTTLNVYTHVNFEDAKAEIEKLNVM